MHIARTDDKLLVAAGILHRYIMCWKMPLYALTLFVQKSLINCIAIVVLFHNVHSVTTM